MEHPPSLMLSQNISLCCVHLYLGMVQVGAHTECFTASLWCMVACVTTLSMTTAGTTKGARGIQCGHAEQGDDSHPTPAVTGQHRTSSHASERRPFGNLRLVFLELPPQCFQALAGRSDWHCRWRKPAVKYLTITIQRKGWGGTEGRMWERRETQRCVREETTKVNIRRRKNSVCSAFVS